MGLFDKFLNTIGEFGAPLAKEEALLAGYGHAYEHPDDYFNEIDEDEAEHGRWSSTYIVEYDDPELAKLEGENEYLKWQLSQATVWNVIITGALVVGGLTWLLTSID